MRLLFLTLEYSFGTFSGNGTYAVATVRFLRAAGHDVRVLCGAPGDEDCAHASPDGGACVAVPLATWGRLDRGSDWRGFAAHARHARASLLTGDWCPDVVLGVDWTSVAAYEALFPAAADRRPPPLVYCNWRVFARSDPDALALERHAAQVAAATIALSSVDAEYIRATLLPTGAVHTVAPPLRLDVRDHATRAAQQAGTDATAPPLPPPPPPRRTLLCCCVRLSQEKEPHVFVDAVEVLARRGALGAATVVPALVGVPRDEYGRLLVARLTAAAPYAEVHTQFLSPQRLGDDVFARALLNVHPCGYDSFAQSVVEAAAYGCPSLLDASGVGAADVLRPSDGLAFGMTHAQRCDPAALAECIHALLADASRLAAVGRAAQAVALAMDEASTADATTRILDAVLRDTATRG